MSSTTDISWAAGLFEGEGCFSAHRRNGSVIATVVSTDRDVVERFHSVVGVGHVKLKNRRASDLPHHKPLWHWWASGDAAVKAAKLLLPELGLRRTSHITAAIGQREERAARAIAPRPCEQCGTTFSPRPSSSAVRTRFCSNSCRERYRLRREKVKRLVHSKEWRQLF